MRTTPLEWKPSLSVGIPELDAQHRELFRRAALVIEGAGDRPRQDTATLLRSLYLHAVEHCRAEEALMEPSGYTDAAAHRRQHRQFLRELLALVAVTDGPSGRALQPARVRGWLERMLVRHLSEADRELARQARAGRQPAASAPAP